MGALVKLFCRDPAYFKAFKDPCCEVLPCRVSAGGSVGFACLIKCAPNPGVLVEEPEQPV